MHRASFEKDLSAACARIHGTDKDLAAHFAVTRAAGVTLWGESPRTMFCAIPPGAYKEMCIRDSTWTGHASAGAVPAAFAYGEQKHASGKEVITAIVAAYEVYQRIAMAVQPDWLWGSCCLLYTSRCV